MAFPVRFLFAIMLCVANMIIYGLKVNMSITIIGMTKAKTVNGTEQGGDCPEFVSNKDEKVDIDGPYDWSSIEQGWIISVYFVGYLVGMFPSGYFADRFNTKMVLLICIFGNSILTLIVPPSANNIWMLYIVRFLTGLISAANLPIVNVLVSKWIVFEEKSMWIAIIYGGTSLGTVISILSSGMIMDKLGWEAVYYIHGALPILWCIVFGIFFADNPETQKYISKEERELLVNSYGHRKPGSVDIQIPWRRIFKSKPFWALVWTNGFGNFTWYFLLTQLPIYMNKILRLDIKTNVIISCVPYLINCFTNPVLGKILDWGRNKGFWDQTGARKIAVSFSCIPPSILLCVIAYIGCERTVTTVLLAASIVISSAIFVGHLCNHNDLAPNYSGILMGITNTPGTIAAFFLPALVGAIMQQGHTMQRWRYVFWVNIVAQILAMVVFLIWGSGKIQDWNNPEDPVVDVKKKEEEKDTKV